MQKRSILFLALLVLIPIVLLVWLTVLHKEPATLRVAFLDVGQGDAILIESPTGVQMLVDGGRDRAVLRELPTHMDLFDRSLDIVVATHPDADHIGGLAAVFDRYRIDAFIEPYIPNDTSAAKALVNAVLNEPEIETMIARRGQRIELGGGAYADILFPDRDVSTSETNEGSIVMRVVYGDTAFLLGGDAGIATEDYIAGLASTSVRAQVLKAGHHGSRNSTSEAWLAAVDPHTVVISAGEGNSYGHPHEETLERIKDSGAEVRSTIEAGTIVFTSNGTSISEK
jgi:competence protein ComEC